MSGRERAREAVAVRAGAQRALYVYKVQILNLLHPESWGSSRSYLGGRSRSPRSVIPLMGTRDRLSKPHPGIESSDHDGGKKGDGIIRRSLHVLRSQCGIDAAETALTEHETHQN